MKILLMTGTIKPLVNVKHCNPEKRLKEYVDNITRYICSSNFDVIIFAENSGYSFDYKKYEEMAKSKGKVFEYLDVSNVSDNCNMSTGEAYLMKEAYLKSAYLKNTDSFWKVTGRIYIKNINKYVNNENNTNMFLYSKQYDSIQTWFFRANTNDFMDCFLNDTTINKMYDSCIEYAFMDCFRSNKNIYIDSFKTYPNALGINSSGVPYTLSPLKYLLKNIALKFGYFSVKR